MTEDDAAPWRPKSTFWIDVGWASVGLVPAFLIPFATAVVAVTPVVVGSVVICVLGLSAFALLSGEAIEDWWDDFKLENRIIAFGLAAALVVPTLGAVCGSLV